MSARMRTHHIKENDYIDVEVGMPNGKKISYYIPFSEKQKLSSFLEELEIFKRRN